MVLHISGSLLEEPPTSVAHIFQTYPHLKPQADRLLETGRQEVGAEGLLLVAQREFASTSPHDNTVQVLGTDNILNHVALIIRHVGSGVTLLSHVDRLSDEDLVNMLNKIFTQVERGYDDRLQIQLVGGFQDSKMVSEKIILSILGVLQSSPERLELTGLCVGEACTLYRGGTPYPAIQGVGINVKTGIIFSASFQHRGPDMDIRLARTLTGGEGVCMFDIYSPEREELRIGPFSYLPMRSVDIWLSQSDEFILQSLTPCPEVIVDRNLFVTQVRETLRTVKIHPYPSVTIFQTNSPRIYRRDPHTGHWVLKYQQTEWFRSTPPTAAAAATVPVNMKPDFQFRFPVKQEAAFPTWQQQLHAYY